MILRGHKKTTWGPLEDHMGTTLGPDRDNLGTTYIRGATCIPNAVVVVNDELEQNQNSVFTEVADSVLLGKESLVDHCGFPPKIF